MTKNACSRQNDREVEEQTYFVELMMTFHKLLVIASAIQCYVQKLLRTVRGAEKPTGPKLPDYSTFIHILKQFSHVSAQRIYFDCIVIAVLLGYISAQIRHFTQNQSQNLIFVS